MTVGQAKHARGMSCRKATARPFAPSCSLGWQTSHLQWSRGGTHGRMQHSSTRSPKSLTCTRSIEDRHQKSSRVPRPHQRVWRTSQFGGFIGVTQIDDLAVFLQEFSGQPASQPAQQLAASPGTRCGSQCRKTCYTFRFERDNSLGGRKRLPDAGSWTAVLAVGVRVVVRAR